MDVYRQYTLADTGFCPTVSHRGIPLETIPALPRTCRHITQRTGDTHTTEETPAPSPRATPWTGAHAAAFPPLTQHPRKHHRRGSNGFPGWLVLDEPVLTPYGIKPPYPEPHLFCCEFSANSIAPIMAIQIKLQQYTANGLILVSGVKSVFQGFLRFHHCAQQNRSYAA